MLLSEIINKLEKRCPPAWAEEWDNPGLNVGAYNLEVKKISVSLDVNRYTVASAVSNGSDLLVTHHPSIFRPLKNIRYNINDYTAVVNAVKNDLALYSMHTNWDVSSEGVNVILGGLLELSSCEPLVKTVQEKGVWGLGCIGDLKAEMSSADFFEYVKSILRLPDTIMYNPVQNRKIKRVAVAGGSCGDLWQDALGKGADVYITADISYHQREDALESGLSVISCDHGEMEYLSLEKLTAIIFEVTGLPVELLEPKYRNL